MLSSEGFNPPGLKITASEEAQPTGNEELQEDPIKQLEQLIDKMKIWRETCGPELAQVLAQLKGGESPAQIGKVLKDQNLKPQQIEKLEQYFTLLADFSKKYSAAEQSSFTNS